MVDLNRDKILITGATGMVGRALTSILPNTSNIITLSNRKGNNVVVFDDKSVLFPYSGPSKNVDLSVRKEAWNCFEHFRPDYVIHLAAKVGGIQANMNQLGDFYTINNRINTNVLEVAKEFNVKKVVSLLSTCIYPDSATYPLTEEQIHNGLPHESNYAYAHAKRMLDIQSKAYRDQYGCNFVTVVPNNLFGPYDNFDYENSHVVPAVIRKIYEAKKNNLAGVRFWGTGNPLREFTFSEDLAKILLVVLNHYDEREPVNIGNTTEISIKQLVNKVCKRFGYTGKIMWDKSKPDGQYRKPSSNSKFLKVGHWSKEDYTPFKMALKKTCKWFESEYPNVRGIK